jgi:copper homeostasis protein
MTRAAAVPLEICVDSAVGLAVAAGAGVDRVELCAALPLGGLTPGPGLIAAAQAARVPCHAMIRPRPGDFVFSGADLDACIADVAAMRAAGLAGVVIGVAREDSTLDVPALAALIDAAGPMEVTLHRVFDLVPDPFAALEQAIALGCARILTSGRESSAADGVVLIGDLVRRAAGRIQIMAGGGLTAATAPLLLASGVDALHASCSTQAPLRQPVGRIGIAPHGETNAEKIAALRAAMTKKEVVA